jgi:glycerol transport system ATP-binding protein
VTQFGPTAEIYRRPVDLVSARVFSDPPINTAAVTKRGGEVIIGDAIRLPIGAAATGIPDGDYIIGIRPHHIRPQARNGVAASIEGTVLIAELSGSESALHVELNGKTWVSQSHGIHPFKVGSRAKLYVDMDHAFFFGADGRLVAGGG